jgi:hypothetical protein
MPTQEEGVVEMMSGLQVGGRHVVRVAAALRTAAERGQTRIKTQVKKLGKDKQKRLERLAKQGRRYAVYLLYWYKSTNSDAAGEQGGGGWWSRGDGGRGGVSGFW